MTMRFPCIEKALTLERLAKKARSAGHDRPMACAKDRVGGTLTGKANSRA